MKKKGAQSRNPVWSKRTGIVPSKINILYTAGRDIQAKLPADELLIPYDIWTNRAHCLMLERQKIIPTNVAESILKSLEEISALYRKNQFHLDPQLEDIHVNIETFIAEEAGEEVAGWLHTARSRNDQSTTDIRLYVRDRLLEVFEGTIELIEVLVSQAEEFSDAIMPGLTHLRFASVTTWAHYVLSYAQALERDLVRIQQAYSILNQSPLGSVASYGTSWNIDRSYSAKMLGFERVQINTIDCLTNRWEIEAEAALAVSFLMNHLSIISQDLLLFTLPSLPLLEVDDRYVTGSSIMPQKRNLDFAEVTRAKASLIQGYALSLMGIGRSLNSGYNRDEQWTKYIIIDVFEEAHYASKLFRDIFSTLRINKANMAYAAGQGFLHAIEVTDYLTRTYSLPFRISYRIVAETVKQCASEQKLALDKLNLVLKESDTNIKITPKEWKHLGNLEQIIKSKNHIGGTAPEAIRESARSLGAVVEEHKKWLITKTKSLDDAKRFLSQQIRALIK